MDSEVVPEVLMQQLCSVTQGKRSLGNLEVAPIPGLSSLDVEGNANQ